MKAHSSTRMITSMVVLFVSPPLQEVVADTANDLILVQKFACAKPSPLSKQLVLQFAEPDALAWLMEKNGSRLTDFEIIPVETYNELSFYSCDFPLFRQVHNVSVLDDDNGTSTEYHKYYEAPMLTFQLEASCHNCIESQPLFDVIPSKNNTDNTTAAVFPAKPTLQPKFRLREIGNYSEDVCFCAATHALLDPLTMEDYLLLMDSNPVATVDKPPLALTAEEFVMLINKNLQDRQMNITVTHIMELEELTCSSIVRQFTSLVYLDMNFSDNAFPSKEEVRFLEESFVQIYNRLSFESCDPYYRKITRAKLGFKLEAEDFFEGDDVHPAVHNTTTVSNDTYPAPQTPKAASNNTSLWWNTTTNWNATFNESAPIELPKRNIRNAVFTVDAACRNCPVNSAGWFTLFDNGAALELVDGVDNENALVDQGTEMSVQRISLTNLRCRIGSNWQPSFPGSLQEAINTTTCVCPLMQETNATIINNISHSINTSTTVAEESKEETNVTNINKSLQFTNSSATVDEENIQHLYNSKIQQQQEEGLIEVVTSTSNIEEGEMVYCGPNISSFFSQVFSHIRVDPTTISSQQMWKLEQAFMDAYNNLAFRTCDGLFRSITEVELIFFHASRNSSHNDSSRPQHDSNVTDETFLYHYNSSSGSYNSSFGFHNNSSGSFNNTSSSGSIFVGSNFGVNSTDDSPWDLVATLFSIKGECRGCLISSSGTFNLFDDSFDGRRQLLHTHVVSNESLLSPRSYRNGFTEDPSTCICMAGTSPSAMGHGPTSQAFEEVLMKEVAQLDQNGEIESVDPTVGDILEGMQVDCTGEVQDFTSYVYSELAIEVGQITDEVKNELERVVQDTYGSAAFQACDDFFRVVAEVKLLISDELEQFDNVNTTESAGISAVTFEVVGRCRNCHVNNGHFSLFDDAFNRHSRLRKRGLRARRGAQAIFNNVPNPSSGNRASEPLDFCFCPHGVQPGESPPLSIEAFLEEFNRNFAKDEKEEKRQNPIIHFEEMEPPSRGGAPISFFVEFPTASPSTSPPPASETLQPSISKPEPTLAPQNTTYTPAPSPTPEPVTLPPTPQRVIPPAIAIPSLRPTPQPTPLDPTPRPTRPPTPNPTTRQTPSPTPQPTPRPTPSPTPQPTPRPTPSPSPDPTPQPTPTPTSTPTLLATPSPTTAPKPPAVPQPTPSPTASEPTLAPTREPTPDPTSTPTREPTPEPTLSPTSTPSREPTLDPTSTPTREPTLVRTSVPTRSPTLDLTLTPTRDTTPAPTAQARPSTAPGATSDPTGEPTPDPTSNPTKEPTPEPTEQPPLDPTPQPTLSPTPEFTPQPVAPHPTSSQAPDPTGEPTPNPSIHRSVTPTTGVPRTASPTAGGPHVTPGSPSGTRTTPSPTTVDSATIAPVITLPPAAHPTVTLPPMTTKHPNTNAPGAPVLIPPVVTMPPVPNPPATLPSVDPSFSPGGVPSLSPSPFWPPSLVPSSSFPNGPPSSAPLDYPSGSPEEEPSAVPNVSRTPNVTPSNSPASSARPSSSPSVSIQPSSTPSDAPSTSTQPEPSSQPSLAPSEQLSHLPSSELSSVPSISAKPSSMPSDAPTISGEPSFVPSISAHPSIMPSDEPSISVMPSKTPSESPSSMASNDPSDVPSGLPSLAPSATPSNSPSETPSKAPSRTPSSVPSTSPSLQPSSGPSDAPSSSPSLSAEPSSAPTDAPSITAAPSFGPSTSSGPSAEPSDAPSISVQPSLLPSLAPSHVPSKEPSSSPSAMPSLLPSDAPSRGPSSSPSAQPSSTPSDVPSLSPSLLPSEVPSKMPSRSPSASPSAQPSSTPSDVPSLSPSLLPSDVPSRSPSAWPSAQPSSSPSDAPSSLPSGAPSTVPSAWPSDGPSSLPSGVPSSVPSLWPSDVPSLLPSSSPSDHPSTIPSDAPSDFPSDLPSIGPTNLPSSSPSDFPSTVPSDVPSSSPSAQVWKHCFDCDHPGENFDGTGNLILVEFWDESVGFIASQIVSGCSGEACAIGNFNANVGTVKVTAQGTDGWLIDHATLYKNGDVVHTWGEHGGLAWCLSTDPADLAPAGWQDVVDTGLCNLWCDFVYINTGAPSENGNINCQHHTP